MSGEDRGNLLSCYIGRVLEGLAAISHLPGGRFSLLSAKELSPSTQFGIKDLLTGNWVLKVDRVHKRVDHTRLANICDPCIWVPNSLVCTLGTGGKVLHAVGNAATLAAVAVDAYRLGTDVLDDVCKDGRLGKRTGKTAASIGGGWAGGYGGSAAGNAMGAWLGSSVGALFGEVGMVPGAAIGSLLGAVVGGMYGSIYGSEMAEVAVVELIMMTNMTRIRTYEHLEHVLIVDISS